MTREELVIAIRQARDLTETTRGLRAGGVRQLARAVLALVKDREEIGREVAALKVAMRRAGLPAGGAP